MLALICFVFAILVSPFRSKIRVEAENMVLRHQLKVLRRQERGRVRGEVLIRRLRAMGIRDRPTSFRSPWQNGYCERLIGSIRRECLDDIVVFGERHLRHLLPFTPITTIAPERTCP
jgi:transposase InsO family protein